MSTSTADPIVVTIPTIEELEGRGLKPIIEATDYFEMLGLHLQELAGQFPGDANWRAELKSPPTLEEIGAITVFCEGLTESLKWADKMRERLEGVVFALDLMRRNNETRSADA